MGWCLIGVVVCWCSGGVNGWLCVFGVVCCWSGVLLGLLFVRVLCCYNGVLLG